MNVEKLYEGLEFTRQEYIDIHAGAIAQNPTSFAPYLEFSRKLEQELRDKKASAQKELWDRISEET